VEKPSASEGFILFRHSLLNLQHSFLQSCMKCCFYLGTECVLCVVSETANQSGFDPSEFPLLSMGRSRHDSNQGGMMAPSPAGLGRHAFTGRELITITKELSINVGRVFLATNDTSRKNC